MSNLLFPCAPRKKARQREVLAEPDAPSGFSLYASGFRVLGFWISGLGSLVIQGISLVGVYGCWGSGSRV